MGARENISPNTRTDENYLKQHTSKVRRCEANGHVGDVGLFEVDTTRWAGLTLTKVLEGARLAEQVGALCAETRTGSFLDGSSSAHRVPKSTNHQLHAQGVTFISGYTDDTSISVQRVQKVRK